MLSVTLSKDHDPFLHIYILAVKPQRVKFWVKIIILRLVEMLQLFLKYFMGSVRLRRTKEVNTMVQMEPGSRVTPFIESGYELFVVLFHDVLIID